MAADALLNIGIRADAQEAVRGLGDAEQALERYGDAARDAGAKAGSIGEDIDGVGGAAGRAGTGLRDLVGVLEGTPFEAFGAAVEQASLYLDAAAGAADIYSAAQEFLNIGTLKLTATTIANAASTVASTVAQKAASVASKAWAVAQGILNAVLAANPIMLIVLAVLAFIAAIIIAYQKSETFRNIVQALGDALVKCWNWAVDGIKNVIEWIKKAIDWFQKIWDKVKDVGKAIGDALGNLNPFSHVLGLSVTPAALGVAPHLTPAARGAQRAGNTYTVNVNAAPLSNPADIGREVVASIRAFERGAGTTWRTGTTLRLAGA